MVSVIYLQTLDQQLLEQVQGQKVLEPLQEAVTEVEIVVAEVAAEEGREVKVDREVKVEIAVDRVDVRVVEIVGEAKLN